MKRYFKNNKMEKYNKDYINTLIDQIRENIRLQYTKNKLSNMYLMIPVSFNEDTMEIIISDISFPDAEVLSGKLLRRYDCNVALVERLMNKLSSYIYDTESKIVLLMITKNNIIMYIGLFLLDENYKIIC
jgi:hypothetical protein